MPRWEAWVILILLKPFRTQWNMFCQKYCFTKILHTTEKNIKPFSWSLSHRPWILKKEEKWQPPNWQGHKRQTPEPGKTWEAGAALVNRPARTPMNTFQIQQGGRDLPFNKCVMKSDCQGQRRETHRNTEENNSLNVNNRIKAASNSLKKENAPRDLIFKISAAIVRKTVKFLQNA